MKINNKETRSATCGLKKDLHPTRKQTYIDNTLSQKEKQLVRRFDGKPVGFIQDGILKKRVQASRHMLRIPRGWAWDKDILEEAVAEGILKTEIFDTEEEIKYTAKIREILEKGQEIDRGYGLQICLPLYYWKTKSKDKKHKMLF
jgi:hypothetical protein